MGWKQYLLLMTRRWQATWHVTSEIRLQKDYSFHVAHLLLLSLSFPFSEPTLWWKQVAALWLDLWKDPYGMELMSPTNSQREVSSVKSHVSEAGSELSELRNWPFTDRALKWLKPGQHDCSLIREKLHTDSWPTKPLR